jgi:glutamyl-tRNA synthetase
LDAERDRARAQKTTYQYNGTCRHLTAQQVQEKEANGRSFTIRLKVPREEGSVIFSDLVYGTIEKKLQDIDDFIILRANGQPLYVLSNAVDDIRDGITHIIRGQDGLANTPKQVLIYEGLGAPMPKFAHMSLTLDAKKAKISKRKHGEQVAIHYYRDHGFLPWAMVNFLVLLGWARTDSQTFFTKEELIRSFNLGGMNRTNSVFNLSADGGKHFTDPKLININAHYLRHMPIETLFPLVKERLSKADIWQSSFDTDLKPWFFSAMELIRQRFNTLDDFVTYGQAYLGDDFPMDESSVRKHLNRDTLLQWMPQLAKRLSGLNDFDSTSVEAELRRFLDENKIKPAVLMNAMRTALTGQSVGPDFMKMLAILGKDRVVYRLETAHRRC